MIRNQNMLPVFTRTSLKTKHGLLSPSVDSLIITTIRNDVEILLDRGRILWKPI